VQAQRRDPDSLLNWMERLIRRRKETPELGWGSSTLIETAEPALFAHRCAWQDATFAAAHNLSGKPLRATLDLGAGRRVTIEDLLAERDYRVARDGTLELELEPYGYRWLRVK
jgi:maltose alpha-D-glucosyltransferase/alpha-amylase